MDTTGPADFASWGYSRSVHRAGFSLVEIVLALGIFTFAFVGIFGLLPFGLGMARDAVDTTICAQIAQQLTTQAQQTDFSNLPALAALAPVHYDNAGKITSEANAVYQTAFAVSQRDDGTGNQVVSTALPNGATSKRLATVTVCVLNKPAMHTVAASDVTSNANARKYPVLIPDNGR